MSSVKVSRFIDDIDKQLALNCDKNILLVNLDIFHFASETVKAVSIIDNLTDESLSFLIDYATDKAIEAFCRVNQYYSFDSKARNELRKIYSDLVEKCQSKTLAIEVISKSHYERLRQWLIDSNPFVEKIYINADQTIHPVACSEYSPALQLAILHVDVEQLNQPVLDIGCGSHGNLVNYLKSMGIVACGIDRFNAAGSGLITADWLEFDYGKEKWGTIISNLGFSNHFIHHNLREDGNYIEYGKAYMNILSSLKKGGSFHYAPDLPFIEKYLDKRQFGLSKFQVEGYDFYTTILTKFL